MIEQLNYPVAANSATALVLQFDGQRRGVAGRNRWAKETFMNTLRYFGLLAIGSLLFGCSSPQSRALHDAEKSPVTTEARSGGDFLLSLREEGQLPGVSKDDHGEIRFDFASPLPKEIVYPFSPTFQVSLKGQSFTNHYTVRREAKDSPWQLQRSWQTDSEGRTVKEWPAK